MNLLAFVLYALFVAFVSLQPTTAIPMGSWDKAYHLGTYALFALLGYRLAREPRRYLALCAGIVAYGGAMEIGQSFVPGREMSGWDFLANTLGVALGALVASRLAGLRRAAP